MLLNNNAYNKTSNNNNNSKTTLMGISKKLASKISAFFLLVGVITINLGGGAMAAGSATLTISPSSGTYKVGDQFKITINELSTKAISLLVW